MKEIVNEAIRAMWLLSPVYWPSFFLIGLIGSVTLLCNDTMQKKRKNVCDFYVMLFPYVPYAISGSWFLISGRLLSFGTVLSFVGSIIGSFLLTMIITSVICFFLSAAIDMLGFCLDPGDVFTLFSTPGFGSVFSYVVSTVIMFNLFYWLLQ